MFIKLVTQRYLTLLQSFGKLNEQIDLCSLDSRVVFQKKVYFLQEFGCDLGYRFGWYLKGPYSTDLTRDAYEVKGLEQELSEADLGVMPSSVVTATGKLGAFMEDIRRLISEQKGEDYWLELAASLHFLKMKLGIRDKDAAIDRLNKEKPNRFKLQDTESIWRRLEAIN